MAPICARACICADTHASNAYPLRLCTAHNIVARAHEKSHFAARGGQSALADRWRNFTLLQRAKRAKNKINAGDVSQRPPSSRDKGGLIIRVVPQAAAATDPREEGETNVVVIVFRK